MASPDGVQWRTRSSGISNNLGAIAFGNGVFVALPTTVTLGFAGHPFEPAIQNQILTSTDAANWQTKAPGTGSPLKAITFGNGSFMVVGDGGAILESDPILSLTGRQIPSGFELTRAGGVGRPCRIQATTNLSGTNGTNWIDVYAFTSTAMMTHFTDTSPSNIPHRFYRAVSP